MRVRASLGLILLVMLAATFAAVPAVAAGLSIAPGTGEAGSAATVTGSAFIGGTEVLVCWGSASASCASLGTAGANDDGSFSIGVTIPGDASPGDWTVSACGLDPEIAGSCSVSASTVFGVVAAPTTTTTTTTAITTTTTSTTTTTTTAPPSTTTTTTAPATTTTAPPAPPSTSAPAPAAATTASSTTIANPVAGGVPRANATGAAPPTTSVAPANEATIVPDDSTLEVAAPSSGVAGAVAQIGGSGLNLSNPATFWGLWLMFIAGIAVVGGSLWWFIAKFAGKKS